MSEETNEYVLNADQFNELLAVLGSEPTFSMWSGMFWIGFATILVGLSTICLTVSEGRRTKAGADAELILKSFADYEILYDSLRSVPTLEKQNLALLNDLSFSTEYDEKNFEVIAKHDPIDAIQWGKARSTKIYFQSRFELVGKGFFRMLL